MKRQAFISWSALLLLLVAPGCQSTKSEENAAAGAEAANSPALAQAAALAQRFGPIIGGSWVPEKYLAAVQRSSSPRQAQEIIQGISEMVINPLDRAGDSLVVGIGLNDHEGGNLTVFFRPGRQPNSLLTRDPYVEAPGSFGELAYRLGPTDTTLQLTTFRPNRRVLTQTTFRRVRGAGRYELPALTFAVQQLLLVGQYAGTDSLGRAVRMEFGADGRVKGLKGFKEYQVNTDFFGGPGLNIDFVMLDPGAPHSRDMVYRRRGDTLHLYAARLVGEPGGAPGLLQGRRLFTLVRQP